MDAKDISIAPFYTLLNRPFARRNVLVAALAGAGFLSVFAGCAEATTDSLITYPIKSGLVAWSPDGTRIATLYNQGEVALWSTDAEKDSKPSKPLLIYQGHKDVIRGLAWSPDSQQIATLSADSLFTIWDTRKGGAPLLSTHLRQSEAINSAEVAWTPDGTKIAVLVNEQMTIWQANAIDRPLNTLFASSSKGFFSFYWSPDSQRFVEIGLGSMNIWDLKDLKRPMSTLDDPYNNLLPGPAWSPDWTKIALAVPFKHIEIWSADRKRLLATLKKDNDKDSVDHLLWSPDSTHLAASTPNSEKRSDCLVWDVRKGNSEAVVRYNGHQSKGTTRSKDARGTIYALSWSPDSRLIVTIGDNSRTQVWRVR